jgi:hypothetical protein
MRDRNIVRQEKPMKRPWNRFYESFWAITFGQNVISVLKKCSKNFLLLLME